MFLLAVILVSVLCFRVFYVLNNRCSRLIKDRKCRSVKTLVVIGSGGHTTEMLRIVKHLNPVWYSPRIYILAKGDTTSESKILYVEKQLSNENKTSSSFVLERIPRSREVGQSYITSIFTTLYSILACIPVMLKVRPKFILCNGPGTCIPICAIAFLMKVFYVTDTTIIFIESICRVKTLSLSGKILLFFADAVFVQWPQLQTFYKQSKYLGRLS